MADITTGNKPDEFGVTLTVKARHARLWQLCKQVGGAAALARMLGMQASRLGLWVNLQAYPKTVTPKMAAVERVLAQEFGLVFEDLWPQEVRQAIDAGSLLTSVELTRPLRLEQLRGVQSALPPPDKAAMRSEVAATIQDMLRFLPAPQRRIVEMRYGLDGRGVRTLKECAAELGVHVETCRNREVKGVRKLQERGPAKLRDALATMFDIEPCEICHRYATTMKDCAQCGRHRCWSEDCRKTPCLFCGSVPTPEAPSTKKRRPI